MAVCGGTIVDLPEVGLGFFFATRTNSNLNMVVGWYRVASRKAEQEEREILSQTGDNF